MRRIAISLLVLVTLGLLATAPAVARQPTSVAGGPKAVSRVSRPAPKVTVTTSEQGALDIDVSPAGSPSTKVTVNYLVENGRVVESTACIGQVNDTTGATAWGCGSFALSKLAIGRSVSRADLAPVTIPVDRCTSQGCVAGSVSIAASLSSVRSTYKSGADRATSRTGNCKVVTTNEWENAAGTGVLTVDGRTYQVSAPSPDTAGLVFPAISRSPTTTRTTCY